MRTLGSILLLALLSAGAANARAVGSKVYFTPGQPSGYQYWSQPIATSVTPTNGTVYIASQVFLQWQSQTNQKGDAQGYLGRANTSYPQRSVTVKCDLWVSGNGAYNLQQWGTTSASLYLPPAGQLSGYVDITNPAPGSSGTAWPYTSSTGSFATNASSTVYDSGTGLMGYVEDTTSWTCWCPCANM